MKRIFKIASVCSAAALGFATPVSAALLVDTGAGTGGGISLGNVGLFRQWLGSEFTLSADATITSIKAYSRAFVASSRTAFAVIYASDGSTTPGAKLYETAFTTVPVGWYGPGNLDWDLDAGSYWVTYEVRSVYAFDGEITDRAPNPLAQTILSNQNNNGAWRPITNKLSWQIEGTAQLAAPGVPEPASWAMLITGFGLVGAAARRRRLPVLIASLS